jgi:phosphoribosylaminoimidazole-succinocarboxamide synthase
VNQPPVWDLPGFHHMYSGKVRDLYQAPDGRLLFVASDRISAFDWVLPSTIPDKGRILTAMSLWWFERLESVTLNHILSTNVPSVVAGRAMYCEQLDMLPVECVARGYLAGSGLTEYRATSAVCGVGLPPGLTSGSRLPKPIFTPATKAAQGEHDENVTFDEVIAAVGAEEAQQLRRLTLAVYQEAATIALSRGIIVADSKLEFGIGRRGPHAGLIVLADEVLTPDSSRFWPADSWAPGSEQPSFDKQYVRDWLLSAKSEWDRDSGQPPPPLPNDVIERTRERYIAAYQQLTGKKFT